MADMMVNAPQAQVALVKMARTYQCWQVNEVASFPLVTAKALIAQGTAVAATEEDYQAAVAEASARQQHNAVDNAQLVILDKGRPVAIREPVAKAPSAPAKKG